MSTTKPGWVRFYYKNEYYWSTVYLFEYRSEPVPGVHKWSRCRLYRRMRSAQERRWSCDPDHKPYIRGKRSLKMLPDSWEDEKISDLRSRSWKDCTKRRRQWQKH